MSWTSPSSSKGVYMNLDEEIKALENQANELYAKKEALFDDWKKQVQETLYLKDPSKVRAIAVSFHDYRDDPEDMTKQKIISFRLGDFCDLELSEDLSHFNISTTGYFTRDVKDIPKLEEASELFQLAMSFVKKADTLVPFILKGYEGVVASEAYKANRAESAGIYPKLNALRKAKRDEENLKELQAMAAKRVVGTILVTPPNNTRSKYAGIEVCLVTHVAPTKVKLAQYNFYDEVEGGVTIKTALDKGLEYISKYRSALIDSKSGVWVKSEELVYYDIFNKS